MTIKIFTTGGTIDKLYYDQLSAYQVGTPQIADFLKEANVTVDFEVCSVLRKDSLDLTDADRTAVYRAVADADSRRIIVTHGTDTMVRTARRLAGIPDKIVVLVGAMMPARFRGSDAALNIGFALAAVQLLSPGVYIAMNGQVFDPLRTRKCRERNCFEQAGE